jgi:DNA repair exonuclease SbcCD ATPase subunit
MPNTLNNARLCLDESHDPEFEDDSPILMKRLMDEIASLKRKLGNVEKLLTDNNPVGEPNKKLNEELDKLIASVNQLNKQFQVYQLQNTEIIESLKSITTSLPIAIKHLNDKLKTIDAKFDGMEKNGASKPTAPNQIIGEEHKRLAMKFVAGVAIAFAILLFLNMRISNQIHDLQKAAQTQSKPSAFSNLNQPVSNSNQAASNQSLPAGESASHK